MMIVWAAMLLFVLLLTWQNLTHFWLLFSSFSICICQFHDKYQSWKYEPKNTWGKSATADPAANLSRFWLCKIVLSTNQAARNKAHNKLHVADNKLRVADNKLHVLIDFYYLNTFLFILIYFYLILIYFHPPCHVSARRLKIEWRWMWKSGSFQITLLQEQIIWFFFQRD